MAFDIRFIRGAIDGSRLGNASFHGEIDLGGEREEFLSLIGFWSPRDYENQWTDGVRRLVAGEGDSCLITSIHDPAVAEVGTWWLLYRRRGAVYVQNALLLFRDAGTQFTTLDPYRSIPERQTATEDGRPISEWELPISDFAEFLSRS